MSSQRWLVLDIGNTHTVAGIYGIDAGVASELRSRVRFRTDPSATPDEYRMLLGFLFAQAQTEHLWKEINRVVVSTVVPALERTVAQASRDVPCLFINARAKREFDLDLPFPEQLGADRLANVAGAFALAKPPFLIVDAGTATTFCLVDARPAYVGGAIVPGLEISWKALQSRAAKLYSVELVLPESSVGRTTETQIQSGVLLGYTALIEGMTDRLLKDAGPPFEDATIFATGGCIQLLKLSPRFRSEADLTLMGLLKYGMLNE